MKRYWAVVAVGALLMGSTAWVAAQQPSEHEQHHPGGDASAGGSPGKMGMGMMGGKCAMMQKGMDQMQAEMGQAHDKLDHLLHEMNTTTGAAKTDAMAVVINEMVAQSEQMHRMHTDMMQKMMQHMTEHMMQGMGPQAQKPEMKEMMMCPMMKGHGEGGEHGTPEAGADHAAPDAPKDGATEDHSAHHPPAQ